MNLDELKEFLQENKNATKIYLSYEGIDDKLAKVLAKALEKILRCNS